MYTKQILRSIPVLTLVSISLSLLLSPTTFALSKQEFADVICRGQQGPAKDGLSATEACKKKAKKDEKITIAGNTFKLSDYKKLSKADFAKEVEKKLDTGTTTTTPPPETEKKVEGGCAGVVTAIIKCSQTGEGKDLENNGVWALLLMAINIMTAGVGVLAVGGLAYGALLWTTAGGSSAQITKSKEVMFNVVLGIVAFALMFALLQYIVPGGVFKS